MGVQGDVSNLEDFDRLAAEEPDRRRKRIIEFAPLGSITGSHINKIFNVNLKELFFTVAVLSSNSFGRSIELKSQMRYTESKKSLLTNAMAMLTQVRHES